MGMRNNKCKNCEKMFHHCGSCDDIGDEVWSSRFCSLECYKKYMVENYGETIEKFKEFLDSMEPLPDDISALIDANFWELV